MRTAFAYASLLLAAVFFGLLLVWLLALARQGGIGQVPQMLFSLGREAAIYGIGLTVLGTIFLIGARFLLVRRPR